MLCDEHVIINKNIKSLRNSLFLKLFALILCFFALMAILFLLVFFQQSSFQGQAENLNQSFFGLLNFSNLLAIIIILVCASLVFSFIVTRYYSLQLKKIKNQALAIFEGRYTPPQRREAEQINDEFDELSFWLDKIAQSIQTQKELLQHEAEILIKRDYRLLETSNDLKLERDKTKVLLENLDEGLILLDHQGQVILVNSWAEKIIDGTKEQFLGKNLNQLPINQEIQDLYSRIIKKRRPIKKEIIGINPKKETEDILKRFFWVTIVPVISEKKSDSYCIISFRDITREKMINKMKSEFISIAAHQLRTPLSAIKWIFSMLMSGDLGQINQSQKEFLQKGNTSNERMIVLINDLLNVTRIEEGKFLFDFNKLSIKELLEELKEEMIPLAAKNKVKLKFQTPQIPLPRISGDREKLKLAFMNLIENAIKYSNANGTVTVKLNKKIDNFEILVKDTGVGIPPDQHDRIFSKFFRGTNVIKMQTDGTGLGLFITKNIISRHNGQISFKTKQNEGTEFTVVLPITK